MRTNIFLVGFELIVQRHKLGLEFVRDPLNNVIDVLVLNVGACQEILEDIANFWKGVHMVGEQHGWFINNLLFVTFVLFPFMSLNFMFFVSCVRVILFLVFVLRVLHGVARCCSCARLRSHGRRRRRSAGRSTGLW